MDTHAGAQLTLGLDRVVPSPSDTSNSPILLCLLGPFCVLQAGCPLLVRGGEVEFLLCHLALHHALGVPGIILCEVLWPASDSTTAGEALHSRIYSLHKLLGPLIGGASPIVHAAGCYRLNAAAGCAGISVRRRCTSSACARAS